MARGEAFLSQGGDCAEAFAVDAESHGRANVDALAQMEMIFAHGGSAPVVTVGRIAGQYAKPRSNAVDENGLPVYRGNIVNDLNPTVAGRAADPLRMVQAHASTA